MFRRRARTFVRRRFIGSFLLAAEDHVDPPVRRELHDHVGTFVGGPDVVLLIDSDRVCECPGIKISTDLAEIPAIGSELQKLRCRCAKSRTCRVAARIDKNVFFRVHRHPGDFTQIHIRRQAHGIGHRLIWNHGHGLGARRRRQQDNCKAYPTHHKGLLLFSSDCRCCSHEPYPGPKADNF